MAKAVKSKDTGKDKSGKDKPGKTPAKAPSRRSRAAQARARSQSRPAVKGERRGISKFMHDVRVEMGKVTWPTRQDLVQSTIVVLVAVAIAALYTGALDGIFSQLVEVVLNAIN